MTNADTTTAAGTAAITPQGAAVTPAPAKATTRATQKKAAPKAKTGKKAAPTLRKETATKPAKANGKSQARDGSKKAAVIQLLRRKEGATAAEIAKLTKWQPHYADVRIMPTCVGNPVCGAGIAAMESA